MIIKLKPKWVIEKNFKGAGKIIEALEEKQIEYCLMEYKPSWRYEDLKFPYSFEDCVIPYTTLNLGKYLKKYYGMFLNEEALKFHNYHAKLKLEKNIFLNENFLMTTFYDFCNNNEKYKKFLKTPAIIH